jgi:hypothetical protein
MQSSQRGFFLLYASKNIFYQKIMLLIIRRYLKEGKEAFLLMRKREVTEGEKFFKRASLTLKKRCPYSLQKTVFLQI